MRSTLGVGFVLLFVVACSDRNVAPSDGAPDQRRDLPGKDVPASERPGVDVPRADLPVNRDARVDVPQKWDLPPKSDLPWKLDLPWKKDQLPPADQLPKVDYVFPVKDGAVISTPVDILFVIDNSNTMELKQQKLAAQFPALIDALKLGGALPDLHIGVVSTNVGAGNYSLPTCEVVGGDGGKLQSTARVVGCVPPTNPWISHAGGVTNVPTGSADPAQRVKDAFSCIAQLGVGGCGFEQSLEAAKVALDPSLNVNPGFVRAGALLAVVFVTDEDDCSAANSALYDPAATSTLGQLTSYRCTQFGYTCAQPLTTIGTKTGCAPSGTWLKSVASYVSFFQGLKPAGKVFLAAIAGPTSPVTVGVSGSNLELKSSCMSVVGTAVPALRIQTVLDGVTSNGDTGLFNLGIDAQNKPLPVNICAADYAPVMKLLGLKLAGAI